MIAEKDWKWFGHAAHFICGTWCRFHMATQIGEYLISTVGLYVHPSKSGGGEQVEAEFLSKNPNGQEIGCGRFYETMVFKTSKKICKNEKCGCGLPEIDSLELDSEAYQKAGDARAGHMKMCKKWATKQKKRSIK